jgi:hypothetical protein
VPIAPDNLPDDPAALKRIIAAMAQDALTAEALIARLKFQLARYRRVEFGRSSEKLERDTEQLELTLEALETDQAERLATASPAVVAAVETAAEAQKPARRPLPEHLPREDLRHPAPCTCPSCGGALRKISDEVTESCVRQVQQIRHGKRARLNSGQGDIPLFDRTRTIPSSRPALRQSAARSGSQGCRRACGGTGGAGAQRP